MISEIGYKKPSHLRLIATDRLTVARDQILEGMPDKINDMRDRVDQRVVEPAKNAAFLVQSHFERFQRYIKTPEYQRKARARRERIVHQLQDMGTAVGATAGEIREIIGITADRLKEEKISSPITLPVILHSIGPESTVAPDKQQLEEPVAIVEPVREMGEVIQVDGRDFEPIAVVTALRSSVLSIDEPDIFVDRRPDPLSVAQVRVTEPPTLVSVDHIRTFRAKQAAVVEGANYGYTSGINRGGSPPRRPFYRTSDFDYRMKNLAIALFGVAGIVLTGKLAEVNSWMKESWYPTWRGVGMDQSSNSKDANSSNENPSANPSNPTAIENLLPVSGVWDKENSTVWIGPNSNIGIKLDQSPQTRTSTIRTYNGQVRQAEVVTNLPDAIRSSYGQRTYRFEEPDIRRANDLTGKSSLGNQIQPEAVKSDPTYMKNMGRSWLSGFVRAHIGNLIARGNRTNPVVYQFNPYDGQEKTTFNQIWGENPELNQAREEAYEAVLKMENIGKVENPEVSQSSLIHGGEWVALADGRIVHQGQLNDIVVPGSSVTQEIAMINSIVFR